MAEWGLELVFLELQSIQSDIPIDSPATVSRVLNQPLFTVRPSSDLHETLVSKDSSIAFELYLSTIPIVSSEEQQQRSRAGRSSSSSLPSHIKQSSATSQSTISHSTSIIQSTSDDNTAQGASQLTIDHPSTANSLSFIQNTTAIDRPTSVNHPANLDQSSLETLQTTVQQSTSAQSSTETQEHTKMSSLLASRCALVLRLKFSPRGELEVDERMVVPSDYYIHVFLNGEWCESRLVPHAALMADESEFHHQTFSDLPGGGNLEKAWMMLSSGRQQQATEAVSEGSTVSSDTPTTRWDVINEVLVREVESLADTMIPLGFLKDYVKAIQQHAVSDFNTRLPDSKGALDVILVKGNRVKDRDAVVPHREEPAVVRAKDNQPKHPTSSRGPRRSVRISERVAASENPPAHRKATTSSSTWSQVPFKGRSGREYKPFNIDNPPPGRAVNYMPADSIISPVIYYPESNVRGSGETLEDRHKANNDMSASRRYRDSQTMQSAVDGRLTVSNNEVMVSATLRPPHSPAMAALLEIAAAELAKLNAEEKEMEKKELDSVFTVDKKALKAAEEGGKKTHDNFDSKKIVCGVRYVFG